MIFAVTLLVECALHNNSVDHEIKNATRTVEAVKVGYADMSDLKMYTKPGALAVDGADPWRDVFHDRYRFREASADVVESKLRVGQ